MPVHRGSMPMSVQAAIAALDFAPGVFLFDDKITTYLEEMRKHATGLAAISAVLDLVPEGEQRVNAVQVQSDHLLWLVSQLDGLAAAFRPALQLDQRTRSARPFSLRP